jgi:molecular chaperone DnaK (HSP70)
MNFDPSKDEISFYVFGISRQDEFVPIQDVINNSPKDSIKINTIFINYFIKRQALTWSSFKQIPSSDSERINNFFVRTFNKVPKCNGHFSDPSFVFPFILKKIPQNSFSDELVLVLVGGKPVNPALNDLFTLPNPSNGIAALNYIQNSRSYLSKDIVELPISFSGPLFSTNSSSINGITPNPLVYKIVPGHQLKGNKNGTFTLQTDINLSQELFSTNDFKISPSIIENDLGDPFDVQAITLSVFSNNGNERILILDTLLARKISNKWESEIIKDPHLITVKGGQINIPELILPLKLSAGDRDVSTITFQYSIFTNYLLPDKTKLNYFIQTQKIIEKGNIHYSSAALRVILLYILPVLILVGIIIFMFLYGKPRRLQLSHKDEGYLDSLEIIDYKTFGKIHSPFKPWDITDKNYDHLPFVGRIDYRSPKYPLNWDLTVTLRFQHVSKPDGFDLFLITDPDHGEEKSIDIPLEIKNITLNSFSFFVGIRQNDITKHIKNPLPIRFVIEAVVSESRMFFNSDLRNTIEYNFLIGEDLGDVWVGFDPGTTGSCVAVGSAKEDSITLTEDKAKNRIIPSVLVFEKAEDFQPNGSEIPEKIYKHGSTALTLYSNTSKYQGFQSIKKLLGFKDIKKVIFENNNTLALQGKDLAGLLVKGLFKDLNTFFSRPNMTTDNYHRDNQFKPTRAVVAIPNNFTISKIQDIIDCINKLSQFKEIRYVYEAEAVVFYYLSNSKRYNLSEDTLNSETILVFDMGGATINATIVAANKKTLNGRTKYFIDRLGKIGFGIGGDTIDYCICKFILSFTEEFPEIKGVNIFGNQRTLSNLASKIKIEVFRNYGLSYDYLITRENLQSIINNELNISILISKDNSEMYNHFLKINGRFSLFSHPFFKKIIFDNIVDAVNEVVELSEVKNIDKVIFSGRSTQFPIIKDTVENTLKKKKISPKIVNYDKDELKTAVAQGACWYGINKNSVRLNNLKTNASFGFKRTLSADKSDVKFYELIKMGCAFDMKHDSIDCYQGVENINDDFAFDGGKVNFFQVMGKDADKILSSGQKHKFSKIASIPLDLATSKIAMRVNKIDDIECAVILQSNRKIIAKGEVADQEIDEANEEHYTWIVK